MFYVDVRKADDYGIGVYIRNVVPRVLSRFDLERNVEVCVLAKSGQALDFLNPYVRVPVRTMSSAPFTLAEQVEFQTLLKPSDVLWATSLSHPLIPRCRLVATVHDLAQLDLPFDGLKERFKRYVFLVFFKSLSAQAKCLMFDSEFTRGRFEHHFSNGTQMSEVGLLASSLTPPKDWAPQAARGDYFVVVGNLRKHKNIPFLVDAFLSNRDLQSSALKIIGPKSQADLRKACCRWDESRVQPLGFVDEERLITELSHARALLFPSIYEGFGLPALEALALACPVIAADGSALREVCAEAGFYFDPRSTTSFDSAVAEFLRRSSFDSSALSEECLARSRLFSWDRCAQSTYDLFRRAL